MKQQLKGMDKTLQIQQKLKNRIKKLTNETQSIIAKLEDIPNSAVTPYEVNSAIYEILNELQDITSNGLKDCEDNL